MEENNQVAAGQKPQQNSKIITLLIIVVPVLMILSYFLPWLSTGLPGQKHSVLSVSGYTVNRLKPDNYSEYMAQHFVKDFAIDSIASAYRIEDVNVIRIVYNTLVNEEIINKIRPHIKQIEETRFKVLSEYLARENHTRELINHYITKEAEEIPGIIEDLVGLFDLINEIDEQKIITGKVSKLDAVLRFLKKYSEPSFNQANNGIKETRKLLVFLNTIGWARITTNKISKAEVIKKYLAILPQEKLSADDKAKILATIEEASSSLVFLYDLGERNIFENIITRRDALLKLPSRISSPFKETLEKVSNHLDFILDEIEKITMAAIVSETVTPETIVNNITAASRERFDLNEEDLQEIKETSTCIIDSLLLLNEKDVSDKEKNRLLLDNTLYPKLLLRLTSDQPALQKQINRFLACYNLINKVTLDDFVGDVLPAYIKNRIYNKVLQQELAPLNPEIAELGTVFDRGYKLGSANLDERGLSASATDSLLVTQVTNTVSPALLAKLNIFSSIFDTVQTHGKAGDLSGDKISGLIADTFPQRLTLVVTHSITEWMKTGESFTPDNMVREVSGLLPEDTPFAQRVKSLLALPENVQKLQKAITEKEGSIIRKIISDPVKIQIEKISVRASGKQGFIPLVIQRLQDPRFQKKLDTKIRKVAKRYPVVYEAHNTIMDLYTNAAITVLATDITQAPDFINKLRQGVGRLNQDKDLKQDELDKLTPSKLRVYHRAVTYLEDSQEKINSIYQAPGRAPGIINSIVTDKRLKDLVLPDKRGFVNTLALTKSIYAMTDLFQKSLAVLTDGTRDLKWIFLVPILGLVLLIVFLGCRVVSPAAGNTVVLISGLVCLVMLFIFVFWVSALSPGILSHLGIGLSALFLGLLAPAIAGLFSLPRTTIRTQMILLGGFIVWLGFFLPWTGLNPNALFTWRNGYHLMMANIQPLAPFFGVWNISSSFGLIFPLIATLLIGLILITKRSSLQGMIIFILSSLSIVLFVEFIFCIPQASTVWAAGILAISSGFTITVLGTAIRS